MNKFLKEFKDRGFFYQCTGEESLSQLLDKEKIRAYIGFDCTAESLHVGSLLQIMCLRLLQKHGHQPIVLLGGGTTRIGDPSGKNKTRTILSEEEIEKNINNIEKILKNFLDDNDPKTKPIFVNNYTWLKNLNFWFISKNKEEPRLANRFDEVGAELEQPLAIARDIKKLYEMLLVTKNSWTIARFLSTNNELRHVIRRAFIVEKFPYSEIQDNTIGQKIMPIDMLRLKLSFFGALKFDPRSDKWLRICMFQGAPLPEQLKNYDEYWVYN
ncbi:tyrosine--tRNA ligase [Candidatus Pelagibacter sp.]|nr:tyrosine--tRNA ligase [Candidatus Pelagibacter sp.]